MSDESVTHSKNSIVELQDQDQCLKPLLNTIEKDSASIHRLDSPSLECRDSSLPHIKEPFEGYQNLHLNLKSNTHTPLLACENPSDNENIPDIEDDEKSKAIETNEQNNKRLSNNEPNENTNPNDENDISLQNHTHENLQHPSQLQLLKLYRKQYLDIYNEMNSEGLKYYYIDPSWFHAFLYGQFNESEFTFGTHLGPILTSVNELLSNQINESNFISFHQFKFLLDIFGIEQNHLYIDRETTYLPREKKIVLNLYPVLIIPHIFCNTPSQVNKYNFNQNPSLQISKSKSIYDLYNLIKNRFDLQITTSQMRLWIVEFETQHSPVAITSSIMKLIKKKSLINNKRKKSTTIQQNGIENCHIMVEVKVDGIFYLDISSHVLQGSGLVGLNNLGNTCYMNSALQCLMHIPELNYYFLYHFFEKELNKDNPLGNKGKVAVAFGNLISAMFDSRFCGNQTSYAPREFKHTIGHFNSLFADYHQQDSQEFIAYLLDGLHEDLNRVLNKPYVEKPELENGRENDPNAIRILAEKCWDAHLLRNNSVIVNLFVALYKSTLVCPICDKVSITFDPYNDLTLPLPITKKWSHKVNILPATGVPTSLEVQLLKNSSYIDLKKSVAKCMDISFDDLIGVEILRNTIYKNFEDSSSDSRYLPISELISHGDNIWFYEIPNKDSNVIIPVFSTVVTTSINNYGLPFFISLTKEECKSYHAIECKMLDKYAQLSTSTLFNKINNKKIDQNLSDELIKALSCEDEEEENEVSTSIDNEGRYNNENKEKRYENVDGNDYVDENMDVEESIKNEEDEKVNNYEEAKNDEENEIAEVKAEVKEDNEKFGENEKDEKDREKIENSQRIIKENNETPVFSIESIFISRVADSSYDKVYYNRHYRYSNKTNAPEPDSTFWFPENHNTITRNDLPTLIQPKQEDNDEIMDDSAKSDVAVFENLDLTNQPASKPNTLEGPEIKEIKKTLQSDDSPDFDEYFEASDCIDDLANSTKVTVSGENMASLVPASPPSRSSELSPSTSSPINSDDVKEELLLIKPRMIIVNEFNENSFELLFCGTSDNQYNGSGTWTTPRLSLNKELEEEKRLSAEKAKKPVSLYDCLELFSKPEILGQNDLWYCPGCKEHRQASKKIEIWSVPDILTIHLKRFESTRSFSDKIDIVVDFPIDGLNLTKHVADKDGDHIYDLFAVDNHYGGLGGGHYTAYVKNHVDEKWYYFDDSRVTPVSDPTQAIKGSAYLLFYRKRSSKFLGGECFQQMANEIQKRREQLDKSLDKSQMNRANSTSETSDDDFGSTPPDCLPESNDEDVDADVTLDDDVNEANVIANDDIDGNYDINGNDDGIKRRKISDGPNALNLYEDNQTIRLLEQNANNEENIDVSEVNIKAD